VLLGQEGGEAAWRGWAAAGFAARPTGGRQTLLAASLVPACDGRPVPFPPSCTVSW